MRTARLILPTLLALGLSLWGLGQGESPADVPLRIAAPRTISSAPLLVLHGSKVAGRVVEVELYDDHPLAMAEFLSGRYEVLFTGYQLGLSRWLADRQVLNLATVVWGVSALVVNDPSLSGLASLRGKTVLVPFAGSPLEVQLKALLRAAGLDGQVTLDYSPITQMPALLAQGRAHAIAIPEPLVSRLVSQGQGRVLFTFASEWDRLTGDPRSPQVCLFVRTDRFTAEPEVFQALRQRVKEVAEGLYTDSDVAVLASRLELPPALLVRALGGTLFGVPDRESQLRLHAAYHRAVGDGVNLSLDFFAP